MKSTSDRILVERADGVLTMTLNKPKFRNAISADMPPRLRAWRSRA